MLLQLWPFSNSMKSTLVKRKGMTTVLYDSLSHRVITVIEPQSLVVFCYTALLTMVGATASTLHMIGKMGGIFSYLSRQNVAGFEPITIQHGPVNF